MIRTTTWLLLCYATIEYTFEGYAILQPYLSSRGNEAVNSTIISIQTNCWQIRVIHVNICIFQALSIGIAHVYYCQSTALHRTVMILVANFDLAYGNILSEHWHSTPLVVPRQSTKEMAGISSCTLVPLSLPICQETMISTRRMTAVGQISYMPHILAELGRAAVTLGPAAHVLIHQLRLHTVL